MIEKEVIDAMNRQEILNSVCMLMKNEFDVGISSFIMVEGEWGSGKTFFLNLLKNQLNQEEYIKKTGIIIEYNCWEDSYYDDPLTAILVKLQEAFSNKQIGWNADSKDKMNKLIDSIFTLMAVKGGMFELPIKLKSKICTKNNKDNTLKKQIDEIRNCLYNDFKQNKIVLIVDELDRCLPEYSIKTLERLYLLFKNAPNFTVIIGNNSKQLEFSIKNIFGKNLEYKSYLGKFIDHYFFLHHDKINIIKFMIIHDYYFKNFVFLVDGKQRENQLFIQMLKNFPARKRDEIIKQAYVLNNNIYDQNSKHESYICLLEVLMVIMNPEDFIIKLNEFKNIKDNSEDDILFPFFKYILHIIGKRYINKDVFDEDDTQIFKLFASIRLTMQYMIEMNLYSSNYPENEGYLNLFDYYDANKLLNNKEKEELRHILTIYSMTHFKKEIWR